MEKQVRDAQEGAVISSGLWASLKWILRVAIDHWAKGWIGSSPSLSWLCCSVCVRVTVLLIFNMHMINITYWSHFPPVHSIQRVIVMVTIMVLVPQNSLGFALLLIWEMALCPRSFPSLPVTFLRGYSSHTLHNYSDRLFWLRAYLGLLFSSRLPAVW